MTFRDRIRSVHLLAHEIDESLQLSYELLDTSLLDTEIPLGTL